MNTGTIYSTKAEKYAKYRWDYAPEAIEAIVGITRMSTESTIADIGAGPGILTKHLVDKAQRVFAVEPNAELRQILSKVMGAVPSVSIIDGSAESTGLSNDSVDVLTVAQAIHWFDPEPSKKEMNRILKRGGWLALLRNYGTHKEQNQGLGSLITEEYGVDFTRVNVQKEKSPGFYFGHDNFRKVTFPFRFIQNWDEFIGALTTASYIPDDDHPLFGKLEAKAREVFSKFNHEGYWMVEGETELIIGQPSKEGDKND